MMAIEIYETKRCSDVVVLRESGIVGFAEQQKIVVKQLQKQYELM
jgi:hypothetical protein